MQRLCGKGLQTAAAPGFFTATLGGREGGTPGPAGQGPPHLPATLPAGEAPDRGPWLVHPHQ